MLNERAGKMLLAVAIVCGVGLAGAVAMADAMHATPMATTTQPAVDRQALDQQLQAAQAAVESAGKALDSNDVQSARTALAKATELLASARKLLGTTASGQGQFANIRCPIMGSKIDPKKVTSDLIREYKGQKVAFCCSMCPPQWDKLSESEKDAKLKAASEAK
ncbi:MAG: hypothetical protein WC869_07880 [Phycisphaerae bacterium]|jgi:hypothetical protein